MTISNRYEGLDSKDDDEETMVNALSSMKKTDLAYLNAIARQVKTGEILLPEVDFDHGDDFHYVWVLVDSGAGAHVARRDQLPD